MKAKFVLMATLFLTLIGVCAVFGADVYVRAGASGKGTSKQDPFGELWKAVDRARRGDVIHVAAGTYKGKGGSGHFTIKVPQLTLAGGYNQDFSERNPFKNFTILERAADFKGDWTGLPEGIIAGDSKADHSNLTVDGFVLNAQSRNHYQKDGDRVALRAPTYPGLLFQANAENIKLRNSILLNAVGNGIYCTWRGEGNELSNNFILNTFYAAVSTRSAQPESVIRIRNNTIAFVWFMPGKGGGVGIFVGRQGQTIMENNVISFIHTEGDEDGFAVKNTFGNDETIMVNNTFFSCVGGYYKYMDYDRANLVVWKPEELEELNDEDYAEDYMLLESGDNRAADPGLKPDRDYAIKFANFIESKPGKLNMDAINEWRRSIGLPLQAAKGSTRSILAPAYPLDKVVPGLTSSFSGIGVQVAGPFAEYRSAAAAAMPQSYTEIEFVSMKKGGPNSLGMDGKAVTFQAGIGTVRQVYEISDKASKSNYTCVELLIPSAKGGMTREMIYGYLLNGSEAHLEWEKLAKRKDRYNEKGGIYIKGQVYSFKNQTYPYPVGVIINEVSRKK